MDGIATDADDLSFSRFAFAAEDSACEQAEGRSTAGLDVHAAFDATVQ